MAVLETSDTVGIKHWTQYSSSSSPSSPPPLADIGFHVNLGGGQLPLVQREHEVMRTYPLQAHQNIRLMSHRHHLFTCTAHVICKTQRSRRTCQNTLMNEVVARPVASGGHAPLSPLDASAIREEFQAHSASAVNRRHHILKQ